MRSQRLRTIGNRGDTIVEVLIAIAVVSTVLGAAFVSANRSLNGTRLSQERVEALKFVQEQAELLSAASKETVKASAILNPSVVPVGGSFTINTSLDPVSGQILRGPNNRYRIWIHRESTNSFVSRAQWQKISDGSNEEVYIRYRIYNP